MPELLILHIRHIVVVCILERFRDTALISLLVLASADEAIDEREDYAHRGGDHLGVGLAPVCNKLQEERWYLQSRSNQSCIAASLLGGRQEDR